MPLTILQGDNQAPLDPLRDRTVAVLGYGNQGAAHAQNLRDSGLNVLIGHPPERKNAARAKAAGFSVHSLAEATAASDLIILALPDEAQPEIYAQHIAPNLKPAATIGFLHGFNICYHRINPPPGTGVIMVAPKGPGTTLRMRYERGEGIPCLFAVHQESSPQNAEKLGLAWANAIGCARAAIVYTTFAHETETDLFGEQTVLCGGMTELILAAFETLVEQGYPPELAYLECCHEVKQVADLVYEHGLAGMMQRISNTAEFGAYSAGPIIIDDHVRQNIREILKSIRNGAFAESLCKDHSRGFPWFEQQRQKLRQHPVEPAGSAVRAMMPWLNDKNES